jgi:hypothetical protein
MASKEASVSSTSGPVNVLRPFRIVVHLGLKLDIQSAEVHLNNLKSAIIILTFATENLL